MSARYRILIADPLLSMGLQWPAGVRLVEPLERGPAGTHWHLLEDAGAPAELEGREIALTLARIDGGVPVITGRHLIVTHLVAEGGAFACCETAPWDRNPADSVTSDPQAATCPGVLAACQGG